MRDPLSTLQSGGAPTGADAAWSRLRDATIARYAPPAGSTLRRRIAETIRGEKFFVAGKLRYDPLYRGMIAGVHWPAPLRLLDLGCGRGILLALLAEARALSDAGGWPAGWPPLPPIASLVGVDLAGGSLRMARRALGGDATLIASGLESFVPDGANAIVLSDVLHYLDRPAQEALLRRACAAVSRDGLILVRELDSSGGLRGWITRAAERARAIGRGRPFTPLAYRPVGEWAGLLRSKGLEVRTAPLDAGTPFANGLIQARTGPAGSSTAADAAF